MCVCVCVCVCVCGVCVCVCVCVCVYLARACVCARAHVCVVVVVLSSSGSRSSVLKKAKVVVVQRNMLKRLEREKRYNMLYASAVTLKSTCPWSSCVIRNV